MIELIVNGETYSVDADPAMPLLWVLRDLLGLTGTKFGCGISMCGACTVHLDGQSARSCVLPVVAVGKRKVTTIEGLDGRVARAVQAAWIEKEVAQCGYCQSGQVMSAVAWLATGASVTDESIDAAMSANVCRCATYVRIRAAIKLASQRVKQGT